MMFYYGVSHKELDEFTRALLDDRNNAADNPSAERIIEFYKHDYEGFLELPDLSFWNDTERRPEEDEF